MHEVREHLPIEYAVIAFVWGWTYVTAAIGVLFALYVLREVLFNPKDERDSRSNSRPFMTPALKEAFKPHSPRRS